ncbi:uncharacterized protein C8A04DRAFT_37032 [Dichotomopilus funicola]|uniref:Zn(2)-C6 fungal-type domain-containing protein n=1 Tax=Dichotomopilus funicola TaxID=1934379 RepID=A0AAN6V5Q2_9PEZI|nr:hypothetical protein C8A04DRAFT_37032 [Dichotomopilus funicola]
MNCFRTVDRPRNSIRARFTNEERERVLGVRRQGACLRCRMLKIQCSLDNPCQPCLQSAVRGSERKVLSFCYCVRTRFADVNIFDTASLPTGDFPTAMQAETLMLAMSRLLTRIATPAHFSFTSNPAAFNSTMVSWLTDPDFHLPNGSIVGLCCSSLLGLQFQEDPAAGTDGLMADFRHFLLATSLAHAGWRDNSSPEPIRSRELCAAGHISGYRLLKRLDRILTPQFLSRCGRESCQVLFLLVLGAVLGVGYSSSRLETTSPEFPSAELLSPEFQRSPTLWLAMKEHLCQMLAHHLIFIGSMLGIKLETGVEQMIIDTAANRWNKAEAFVWADMVGYKPDEENSQQEPLPTVSNDQENQSMEDESMPIDQNSKSSISSPVRSPQLPEPPKLVPIPVSDAPQFQQRPVEAWAENPQSYLSMFDEPSNYVPHSSGGAQATPRGMPSPTPEASQPPERKRRSMWIVRPYDAGPERGLVNVRARLYADRNMESLRAFV